MEVLLQGLVGPLSLTITFWVITRGEMKGHAEGFSKRAEEMGDELQTSVGGDMTGNSVLGEYLGDKQLH